MSSNRIVLPQTDLRGGTQLLYIKDGSTKKKFGHTGKYNMSTVLGEKRKRDVNYVRKSCDSGKDGQESVSKRNTTVLLFRVLPRTPFALFLQCRNPDNLILQKFNTLLGEIRRVEYVFCDAFLPSKLFCIRISVLDLNFNR